MNYGFKPLSPDDILKLNILFRVLAFEGRDLNSTIDARSVYASAMSTVFDVDFKLIKDD